MKLVKKILLSFHLFVAIGAFVGGIAAIKNPQMPLGTSTDLLQGSPFKDYLIPGIILLVILGLGNIIAGISIISKFKYQPFLSIIISFGIIIWILVQVVIMGMIIFAHVLFFCIGTLMTLISFYIMYKEFNMKKYIPMFKGESKR